MSLIKSDLIFFFNNGVHIFIEVYILIFNFNFNYLLSVTAGGLESTRGHM